jgi:hypothetical protein
MPAIRKITVNKWSEYFFIMMFFRINKINYHPKLSFEKGHLSLNATSTLLKDIENGSNI